MSHRRPRSFDATSPKGRSVKRSRAAPGFRPLIPREPAHEARPRVGRHSRVPRFRCTSMSVIARSIIRHPACLRLPLPCSDLGGDALGVLSVSGVRASRVAFFPGWRARAHTRSRVVEPRPSHFDEMNQQGRRRICLRRPTSLRQDARVPRRKRARAMATHGCGHGASVA